MEALTGGGVKLPAMERHYSPGELAEMWGVSAATIRRWFDQEPGVVRFGSEGQLDKRRKILLRIPASVAQLVHERLVVK